MKLLANNLYGYRTKNGSRRIVAEFLNDDEKHSAIKSEIFKRFYPITKQL